MYQLSSEQQLEIFCQDVHVRLDVMYQLVDILGAELHLVACLSECAHNTRYLCILGLWAGICSNAAAAATIHLTVQARAWRTH